MIHCECGNVAKLGTSTCGRCQRGLDRQDRIDQAMADYYTSIQDVEEGPVKDTLEALFALIEAHHEN